MKSTRKQLSVWALALLAPALLSCEGEINRGESPVQLIATTNQTVSTIDLASVNCASLGTISLTAITKRLNVTDTRFLDVQLRSYRVSYVRTDGGTVVPDSFVRSISGIVAVNGGSLTTTPFFAFDQGALLRAPFVAILPNNGGVDPQTGKRFVQFDVITEIFGETLSGQSVSATAREAFTVCVACGGCR